MRLRVRVGERWHVVELGDLGGNPIRVQVDGESMDVEVEGLPRREASDAMDPEQPSGPARTTVVRAPMMGVILSIDIKVGQQVSKGERLCILEALKLQAAILAPSPGTVRTIHMSQGLRVKAGETLAELDWGNVHPS